jgi:hypothetical protein
MAVCSEAPRAPGGGLRRPGTAPSPLYTTFPQRDAAPGASPSSDRLCSSPDTEEGWGWDASDGGDVFNEQEALGRSSPVLCVQCGLAPVLTPVLAPVRTQHGVGACLHLVMRASLWFLGVCV